MFEALQFIERSIEIDPHYGQALSWAAICHMRLVIDGWTEHPEKTRDKALDFARRALEVAQNDPATLANAVHVLTTFDEDIGTMTALIDRALAFNPSFARGWYVSGMIRNFSGDHDLAIEHLETSLRLSPREPVGSLLVNIGMAHFFKRRFSQAVPKLLLAIQESPGHPTAYRVLASCYAHMDQLDDAHAVVAKLRAITGRVVADDTRLRLPEDRELYLSGLRLAAGGTV